MRIALYCNIVSGGWSPLSSDEWGGGEEAIVSFSEALTRRGHQVSVFGSGYIGTCRDVEYLAYAQAELPDRPSFDVAIYRKTPEAIGLKLAPLQFLWTDQVRPFDGAGFHRVVVASEYLRRCVSSLTPQVANALRVIPDGYDAAMFAGEPQVRDAGLVVHASSPDRGLVDLLKLWPRIEADHPNLLLLIAYGWDLHEKCGGDPRLRAEVESLIAACRGVEMRRLTRQGIHDYFRAAGIWAYWCNGGEFFCQSAVKAQVGGCIPVVKPWGALHETVRSGFKVTGYQGEALVDAFVGTMNTALYQAELCAKNGTISADVVEAAKTFPNWDQVAEQWEALFAEAEPPKLASRITRVPAVPDGLLPKHEETAPSIVGAFIAEWLGQVGAQRPWVHPSAGFALTRPGASMPSGPREADAVALGWTLEEAPDVAGALEALGVSPGAFVVSCLSYGPWRAKQRKRLLERRDLLSLFKDQPEFGIRCLPLDGDTNGIMVVGFRYAPEKIGQRDKPAARARLAPRETLSACFIARNAAPTFLRALKSVEKVADEIIVVDTGSTDHTIQVVEQFQKATGFPVSIYQGTSPRFCYDCQHEHAIGEMAYGHRFAGFETPRNESIGYARGDHVLWLDTDEELLEAERLDKYLRPNAFAGYAIAQHHWSIDPPQASKIDNPVRIFRRIADGQPAGLRAEGPEKWPTYHPGTTARFAGIVHEHPGFGPTYAEGVFPVVLISDVWIAHSGYFTETWRRGRFIRNWPLMVADRLKYPERRLGKFLWIRDLVHHMRYLIERNQGRLTPESAMLAEEALDLYRLYFAGTHDPFSADALGYASSAAQALQRGIDVEVIIKARRPEVSPEQVEMGVSGRFEDWATVLKALEARKGDFGRFEGKYL